jgi:phage gp36-like protein
MTYATQADMVKRFGDREMISLTDRDNEGFINTSVLNDALESADSEINTYLHGHYPLPLTPLPTIVRDYACDIARFRLCGGEVIETQEVRNRYEDARSFFSKVADGKVSLGVNAQNQSAPALATVKATQSDRTFTKDSLVDF